MKLLQATHKPKKHQETIIQNNSLGHGPTGSWTRRGGGGGVRIKWLNHLKGTFRCDKSLRDQNDCPQYIPKGKQTPASKLAFVIMCIMSIKYNNWKVIWFDMYMVLHCYMSVIRVCVCVRGHLVHLGCKLCGVCIGSTICVRVLQNNIASIDVYIWCLMMLVISYNQVW